MPAWVGSTDVRTGTLTSAFWLAVRTRFARERVDGPWRLQLLLNPSEADVWIYRRDPRVKRPLAELVWRLEGIRYLVPEVQLLFKSKTLRRKDERDLRDCLPLLTTRQRRWLRQTVTLADATHPWLSLL